MCTVVKFLNLIKRPLLVFLTNYLKDREQCVVINGCKSGMKPVASGVPQGSILGPLLFVLFINDIVDGISEGTNIALYADDTKIWRTITSWGDHIILQGDIDCLYQWSLKNNMRFHPGKCKVLQCNNKKVSPHGLSNVRIICNSFVKYKYIFIVPRALPAIVCCMAATGNSSLSYSYS